MPMTVLPSTAEVARRPRQRLRPDDRAAMILDAALQEFSARGYEATRVDDIARRAGLSKGGLYAHFESKEEIFAALVDTMLVRPVLDVQSLLQRDQTPAGWLPALIETLYGRVQDMRMGAMVRVLLAEGPRVPERLMQWTRTASESLQAEVGALLRSAVDQGRCRDSILVRHPWLIFSPLVHSAVRHHTGLDTTEPSIEEACKIHVQMLRELLAPAPTDPPGRPVSAGRGG